MINYSVFQCKDSVFKKCQIHIYILRIHVHFLKKVKTLLFVSYNHCHDLGDSEKFYRFIINENISEDLKII